MRTRHLIILILACLFQMQFVFSQTNKLYISPTDCPLGKTTQVEMRMDNCSEVVAMQFNLHIPDVVKLESIEGIQLAEERKDDHSISVTSKGNNNYLVVVMSGSNKPFKLVSGAVIQIPLVVPDDLEVDKEYPFGLTNVVLADRSGKNVMTSFDAGKIKIVDDNGPDITPKNIQLQSDDFKPGGNVALTWDVDNIGGKTTDDGWSEYLYLVDELGNEYALGNTRYTETLSAKGSISRKAEYKMSDYPGIEGKVKAKVVLKAFSGWELPVYGENNEGKSQNELNMPKVLAWSVNATVVQEKGSPEVSCMLGRSGSRQKEETFTLTNGSTARLQVPEQITIPKGESGTYFKIKVKDNEIANLDSFVVVNVTGNSYQELKKEIWIEDDEHPYLKMSVAETEVKEGGTVTMALEREWDIPWPLEVRLRSDHSNRFTGFPSTVIIPANQKTVEVKLNVANDDLPGLDDEVVFTASAPGHIFDLESLRFLKILDDDIPGIDLVLSTTTVSEVTQSVVATLKRTGVTTNKVTVHLTDNGDGRISMPASIVLEPGMTEKQFAIKTVDNAMKDGDKEVTIKGAIYVSSCNCSTAGTEAGVFEKKITVLDDDDARVTSVASKTTVLEGEKGKITVSVNEVLSTPLTVTLSCDNKEINLPASVTIPAGSRTVDVEITVPKNNVSEGNRIATVVFDAGSYGKSTCWLNITDQTLPDAVVTTLQAEKEIPVNGSAKVSLTVKNEGAASLSAQTKVSVYLSTEKNLNSSSVVLGNLYTQTELAVGGSVTLEKNFTFPEKTGDYYLIAVVNEEQTKKELSYINNTSAPVALALAPLYTVQVSLDKTTIKTRESVMVTGQVTGSKTAGVPVDLYIINNGYRKVISVTTDNSGVFQKSFMPDSWQLGHFCVGACYPDEGLKEEMTGFDLYGLKKASSGAIMWEVFTGEKQSGSIKLSNPGNKALSNITAKVVSQPKNCQIHFSSISAMAADGTADLPYEVTGSAVSSGEDWEPVKVQLTSAEGAVLDLDIYYYCRSHAAQLEVDKPIVNTTMTIGSIREYPITITNTGKGETGEISVVLPNTDWMSLATPAKMPSLKYGESATVLLRLSPGTEMEANVAHKGQFAINCANGNGVPVSYRILPVSSENGTLVVDVCDEYTYYTAEKPHISGAKVRVTIPNTNTVVAEGVTEITGLFTKELPAGYYTLEVTADKHDSYKNTILVDPGKENKTVVNLSFQAITYSWSVEETEIQDEYTIKTDVKYETNVPKPVILIDFPKTIESYKMSDGESFVFEMELSNKGLITAEHVLIDLPRKDSNLYFELLRDEGFDLLAGKSIKIPVKVTKKASSLRASNTEEICIYDVVETKTHYKCGKDQRIESFVEVVGIKKKEKPCQNLGNISDIRPRLTDEELLEWLLWRDKYILPALANGRGLGEFILSVVDVAISAERLGEKIVCNPYVQAAIKLFNPSSPCASTVFSTGMDAVIGMPVTGATLTGMECSKINDLDNKKGYHIAYCAIGGLSTALSTVGGAFNIAGNATIMTGAAVTMTGVGAEAGGAIILGGVAQKAIGTAFNVGGAALGIGGTCLVNFLENIRDIKGPVTKANAGTVSWIEDFEKKFQIVLDEWDCHSVIIMEILGDEKWNDCTLEDVAKLFTYLDAKKDLIEKNDELYQYKPDAIDNATFYLFIDRWINSLKRWNDETIDSNNYIDDEILIENYTKIREYEELSKSYGYKSTEEFLYNIFYDLKKQLEGASNTICSSISLSFSQSMVMTRQAFRGILTIHNGEESNAMQNVKLNLEVSDEDGVVATSREFQINPESLDGFGGTLDGAWTLDAQKTGKATILFIPTKYAAPTEPKEYTFGGTLSYLDPFTGLEVTRDLFPVTMTVNPSPNLEMDYFMQRDILGDDPLTKEVEPMIPSEFSLLIHNVGAGDAKNVSITTSQPKIIDNEKGLLVDFQIKTSQVNGEPETAVMGENVQNDFGTIKSGKTAYAQWWLASTLLGHFTDYKVEATHVTSYDNPDLSLLDTVRIHELIRGVRVDEDATPKVTGFMVNDIPDAEDFPDMMYLTDGTVAPVVKAKDAKLTDSGPNRSLTVTPSTVGWNYISIADPTKGSMKLVSVNGDSNLDTRKVWQTDRTLRDGKDPKYEYRIHVVDYFDDITTKAAGSTPGEFQLVFEERPEMLLAVESILGLPEGNNVATTPVDAITIKFNKGVSESSLTTEMFSLFCQGKKMDTKGLQLKLQEGNSYLLDLSTLTKQNGVYTLTIHTSEIKDADGFTGEEDYSVVWNQLAGGKVSLTALAEPEKAGTVTPASIQVDYGKETEFVAKANKGYQFKTWTINDRAVSAEETYLHTAIVDQTLVANFEPISYKIEISYNAAQGFVTFGTGYYEYDSSLELIATPNDGYRFVGWFIGGERVSTAERFIYKISGDAKLEARFEAAGGGPDDPDNPDGGDSDDPTADEEIEKIVIQVYPTRVTDYVHVGTLPVKSRLILFNLAGKQVRRMDACEGVTDLFMGDQPSGIYLLYILAGEEQMQTVKLIKK